MKKLIILALFALVGWTCFYDLTKGTLSLIGTPGTSLAESESTQSETTIPYKSVKINPGDTVLSIQERLNPMVDINIQKILDDFRRLNHIDPNTIEIGRSYRFPIYTQNP
ncbi:hypothetical protein ACFO4N_04605 [Camelliibacillus cellulosilyticus]|uniref:LysM domain-containing protein n=1 Tax=Camelliibacillus cellulosilyticus TaxID=2174486 RepID=A0ABV9GI82_9BACL